ncbi:low temperature requirement protein A [Halococcus hamelinensis]|uniref:Low temperature requirement protein A n=1 Tax=Halococcus hamelinensis 100A6 TaxID=1132509 RepID=M0LW91_9EURY|nr:low temperature requirement protein A [Halococcus hamelinensis]EMA37736.1 low temperature requirement protein A [Halococcus hamelinensis 100A6]
MSADTAATGAEQEQSVTPLELFFDLVFVFAFTQVSSFLAHHLTWTGLAQGAVLLGVLWWAWVCYSWSTGVVDTEEEMPARLVVLVAMAGMLLVALAVPDAFGESAILFGVAYFVVRVLHVVHYVIIGPTEAQEAILRVAPGFLGGPALLVVAGFFDGTIQAMLWVLAIIVDYGIVYVRGVEGFTVHVGHFVERHRLIMIIALGESIVAIGIGTEELALTPPVIGATLLGIVLVVALWWLYFDYVVLAAEGRLGRENGTEQAVLARDSYSYLHLFIVGSIVFVALGIEQTIAHVGEPLGIVPAVAFCGGCGLYLFGHNAFRYRDHRTVSYLRLAVGLVALALIPVALEVPALATLGLLTALLVGLALYETIWSEHRNRLRSG